MAETLGINQMSRELLAQYRISAHLHLELGDWIIKASSNSPELIRELKSYFGAFVCAEDAEPALEVTALETPALSTGLEYTIKQPDPGKTKIKEEYADLCDGRIVRKRLTGMVFLFGGGRHLAVGPCRKNSNQVINFINNRLIQLELDKGALLAHAAGVQYRDIGLALAGFSGMGKSTLALHMMSLGLDFISNDRLLVRRENGSAGMTGVAKLPRINPGTALNNPSLAGVIPEPERTRFASMSRDELWDLEYKYDVDIARFFGAGSFALHSGFHALGILNWRRSGDATVCTRVDLHERLDLLQAFKKSTGLFYLQNGAESDYSDTAYLNELEGVKVFELSGGVDFNFAAQRLLEELKGIKA